MKLIIAEKPSVGKEIAHIVGANQSHEGYLEGNGYICSWCYGHLLGLYDGKDYNPEWKSWKVLPIIPDEFKLKVGKDKSVKAQFQILKKLMNRDDVDVVVCATDAGREGELIFRHVYNHAKCKKPIQRLWNNSMADIKRDLQHLQDGNDERFIRLYHSAFAREKADWLVGANLTRHFTNLYCNYGDDYLSIGRVQTPTLRMIVDRENEIKSFKKNYYYKVQLKYKDILAEIKDKYEDENEADRISKEVDGTCSMITDIKKEIKKKKAPLLHDIGSLQKECNEKLSISAKETLDTAQKLYEGKFITYPRTDSKYLNESMKTDFLNLLELLKQKKQYDVSFEVDKVLDDSKVTDHHAIIPTKNISDVSNLNDKECSVLNIIIERTLKAVMKDMTYEHLTCTINAKDYDFIGTANKTVEKGWTEFEKEDGTSSMEEVKNISLFNCQKGDVFEPATCEVLKKETKPKTRFNDKTIISAMENAGSKDFKEIEGVERTGLGTGATRADIIEKLISRGYVERKKKQLIPTERGMQLIKVVPENITDVQMTVVWEEKIADIKNGKLDEDTFINDIENYIIEVLKDTNRSIQWTVQNENKLDEKCPKCGSDLVIKKGKYGKFTACSNYPECKYIKKDEKKQPKKTDKKCPKCGNPLLLRKGKFGEYYSCSDYPNCKYTESVKSKEVVQTKMKCPQCGKPLVERNGKYGKFISCSGYPACKYIKK